MRRFLTIALLGAGLAMLAASAGFSQDKPLKKVVFAVTTRDISVGHAAHSSLPQHHRIVVPDDSPIKTVADLKGKTVGVPSLASGSVPFARALIASVGVDSTRRSSKT